MWPTSEGFFWKTFNQSHSAPDAEVRTSNDLREKKYDATERLMTELLGIVTGLQQEVNQLRQESRSLAACLLDIGVLRPQTWLAGLHRVKFEDVCKTYPCSFDVQLSDVMHMPIVSEAVLHQAGLLSVLSLRTSSSQMASVLSMRALRENSPTCTYVCGGRDHGTSTRSAERFDSRLGCWEALPQLRYCRSSAAAAVLDGCVYVCGGEDTNQQALRSVERFSSMQGIWQHVVDMQERRQGAAAASSGDRLFICGGGNGRSLLMSVESFTPRQNQWQAAAPMKQQRLSCAATSLDGSIYVCGGTGGSKSLETVERLPRSDGYTDWQPAPSMLHARKRFDAVALDGFIYVAGGKDDVQVLRSIERYSLRRGVWEELPCMPGPAQGIGMSVLFGGRILVCGGSRGTQDSELHETNILSTYKLTWSPCAPMSLPRDGAVAVTLHSWSAPPCNVTIASI